MGARAAGRSNAPQELRARPLAAIILRMAIDVKRIDVRRFAAEKMQKLGLFATARLFCDVYCLEPGQEQRPHVHQGADKVYVVLEGEVSVRVGGEEAALAAGDAVLAPADREHGVRNAGPARAALLVLMAPPPAHAP